MTLIAKPPLHRWSYEEWDQMVESGALNGRRVELIGGEILDMAPQKDVHAVVVSLAFKAAWRAFGERVWVRCQLPLHLGDSSEPEPDVSVVPGAERDFLGAGHPTSALLVIEVADSSLAFDRRDKASLYASAAIADYWIVNLIDRQIEVLRQPVADSSVRFGNRYAQQQIFSAGQRIKPLAASGEIPVADLLP